MRNYSYTILSTWDKGEHERAIAMLKGEDYTMPVWIEKAMERGKRIHDEIANNQLKLLPFIDNDAVFEDKDAGVNYFKVKILDKPVSLVIDLMHYTDKWILDWKSTKQKLQVFDRKQLHFYAYCLSLQGIDIKTGYLAGVEEQPYLLDSGVYEIVVTQLIKEKITVQKLKDIELWAINTIKGIEAHIKNSL